MILEAWAPDVPSCCEEAVDALVETFVDATAASVVEHHRCEMGPAPAEELLTELIGEVIFLLDTSRAVPVGARVRPGSEGGFDVVIDLADPATVAPTGAAPKAVSRSGLMFEVRPGAARCSFLVDV